MTDDKKTVGECGIENNSIVNLNHPGEAPQPEPAKPPAEPEKKPEPEKQKESVEDKPKPPAAQPNPPTPSRPKEQPANSGGGGGILGAILFFIFLAIGGVVFLMATDKFDETLSQVGVENATQQFGLEDITKQIKDLAG